MPTLLVSPQSLSGIDSNIFRMGPQCESCGLCKNAKSKCLGGRGSASATFAFVSDSPTRNDDSAGLSWSDRRMVGILHEAGYAEEDCYFTSLLKCSLPYEAVATDVQISSCLGYILQEFSIVRPKVIFVTGRQAFQTLMRTSTKDGMGKLRGKVYKTNMPWGEVAIIPTWSPGYARHKASAAQDIIADMMMGKAHLEPPRQTDYRWIDSPEKLISQVDEIIDLSRRGKLEVYGMAAVDIESNNLIKKKVTPVPYPVDHNIATIQVAWNPGQAFIVPLLYRHDGTFNNPFNIAVLRDQMARIFAEIPVVGQNYKFDESYFRVKLGLETKIFEFDTMLAHHFRHGGSLPNNLGFLTSRYLGWVSHKRIIDEELAAMPEDDRRYSNLSKPVLQLYGCTDADATLQLVPILRKQLESVDYKKFDCPVVYPNMFEAFKARTMFPWRAILNIEIRGAKIDDAEIPAVTKELEDRMSEAYNAIYTSPAHAVWLLDHTKANPKRKVFEKKSVYYISCERCSYKAYYTKEGKRPKIDQCPQCGGTDAKINRKMEPTEKFVINQDEPELIVDQINLRSPDQVSKFFYNPRYLGLPEIEDLGPTTNKVARAALLALCEENGMHEHARCLLAVGEYNKAAKLFSSYATKLPEYLFVKSEEGAKSQSVTNRFEISTGVNHIHTNYFQDGTVSGRLSTRAPSLHTIPRKSSIKRLFISRFGQDGLILQGDLSQAEVRAFVIETGDEGLRDAFERGVDPYIHMASQTFGVPIEAVREEQRQDSKSIVLGLLFGRGATAIAEQTKKQIHVIKKIIRDFFDAMPKLKAWIEKQHRFVEEHKCAVSRFGRIRPLVDQIDADDDEMLNHAHNISVNHPIQGMVGDLCIDSVARIEYRLAAEGLRTVIFNTVHDSTILDLYIPELMQVMRIVHEEMYSKLSTYFPWINVPFSIDQELGISWGKGVKSTLKDNVLSMSGDPATIGSVMTRVRRHFAVTIHKADVSQTKDGSSVLKMSSILAA